MFQYPEYQLFEETVYADIAYGPKNQRLSQQEIDRRVREAAAFVGLSQDQFDRSPLELSGGQKRRAAIAGVLAMEPEVLVLDEPTAMLDPRGRREVLAAVESLCRGRGITVVLITHHMDEAARADRVLVMDAGHIAMDGTPREIFPRAEQLRALGLDVPETAALLARLNAAGMHLAADALSPEECADVIKEALCR